MSNSKAKRIAVVFVIIGIFSIISAAIVFFQENSITAMLVKQFNNSY